jgi:hypothetical protein
MESSLRRRLTPDWAWGVVEKVKLLQELDLEHSEMPQVPHPSLENI